MAAAKPNLVDLHGITLYLGTLYLILDSTQITLARS